MHTVRSCYYALAEVFTKKTSISKCQGTLNVIQHALTIPDFAIDYPALLEINRKLAVMGGGAVLILSKNRPLFVRCLSVFFWVI